MWRQCPDRTRERAGAERLYYTQRFSSSEFARPILSACVIRVAASDGPSVRIHTSSRSDFAFGCSVNVTHSIKKTKELTQEATTHPRRPRLRDYHVRSCQRCQAGAAPALATPAPPRVVRRLRFWAGCPVLIHVGTGLPERKTTAQRVAQRVPRRAEAEAYCATNDRGRRRAAAARENDDDADDDGPPALLVVDPRREKLIRGGTD